MEANEFKQRFLPAARRLYATARALTGNDDDAKDLVQETYSKLWLKRESLSQVNNDEAYCISVLRRLFYDSRRTESDHAIGMANDQLLTDEDPQSLIERDETRAAISDIIATLPRQQRDIFTRRDINGEAFADIARATGLTEANVRVTLSRARRQIRELFIKWNSHDNPTNR